MAKRTSIVALVAAIAVGTAASGQTPGGARKTASPPAASKANAGKPSVILITIDTLRADHVGCYGARDVKTPTLDALAHDGVVFERALSQVPLTWPSHAVILTGTYPFQNGVQDFTGQPLGEQFRSVAQAFHESGYATGAVVSAFVLDRSWGLARGFDFYDDAFAASEFEKKDIGLVDRKAGDSVARAIAWLKKMRAGDGNTGGQSRAGKNVRATKTGRSDGSARATPFFLWLHLYDPHSPYDPPEPFHAEYSSHLYDGEIAYADHELGGLIAWLKQNHIYDSSLIVMLSDHGESLGEHGEDEHGFFLYNATVHVPLIVKPPAGSGITPGRRKEAVETTAAAPTLLELTGLKDAISKQFQTQGLLSRGSEAEPGSASGRISKDPAYSETFYPLTSFGWSPLRAMESERYHFIEAPKPELYDLAADPGETKNIASEQPATVAVLREKLQALVARNPFRAKAATSPNLTPEAQEKLRSLGYFGFRATVSPEALKAGLADPKDKLWEFNAILKAGDQYHLGNAQAAEELLEKVQQQDPQIYVVPFMLGEAAIRQQNWERAAQQLTRCLELNPGFDNAMTGLAFALKKLGQPEKAKPWLEKAIQSNPQNYRAWYESGLMEAANNPVAAQAAYEKALAIQPNFSPGQRELGMLLFEQKSYALAASHLEKAIALGLEDGRIHNYLGICYDQTKRTAKAAREYERAIALEPNLADAHLNLAYAYQILRRPKAMEEYRTACKLDEEFCKYVPKQ